MHPHVRPIPVYAVPVAQRSKGVPALVGRIHHAEVEVENKCFDVDPIQDAGTLSYLIETFLRKSSHRSALFGACDAAESCGILDLRMERMRLDRYVDSYPEK